MAIVLKANSSYNLVSENSSSEGKVIAHVKLTDSCLRALEEYQSRSFSKESPSIHFQGQTGLISIPVRKDGTSKFRFNCSAMQTVGNQGCLDCMQQVQGNNDISTFGTITHKINVMATDDSYQTTRVRMKEAEEERKEVRTKIIKMPNKSGAKRNKGNKQQNSIMAAVKRKMQPITRVSNGPSKSMRERVIHLLAVRPYNKLELIYRLKKDGVSLKDSNLTNLLQQVAVTNDNKYKLLKHLYSEVQVETWQDYSETEKQQIQRILQQSGGVNSQMDSSEATGSPKNCPERKRPNANDSTPLPKPKMRRVAPVNTNNNNTRCTYSPPRNASINQISSTTSSKDIKSKGKVSNGHSKETRIRKNLEPRKDSPSLNESKKNSSLLNDLKKDSSLLNHYKDSSFLNGSKKDSSKKNVSNQVIDSRKQTDLATKDEEDLPEYKKKYKEITNYEQRCAYKKDFQAEFDEYRELRRSVDAQTKKFTELDNNYRKHSPESREAKEIGRKVEKLYKEIEEDVEWQAKKRRYQELHPKLDYIKKLISDYDKAVTKRAATESDNNT